MKGNLYFFRSYHPSMPVRLMSAFDKVMDDFHFERKMKIGNRFHLPFICHIDLSGNQAPPILSYDGVMRWKVDF